MGRVWATAAFAVGLLALSAVVAVSDASDAAPPYRFSGYAEYGGDPFDESTADVIIAELEGATYTVEETPDGEKEAVVVDFVKKTEYASVGINDGRFELTVEGEMDPSNTFFLRIRSTGYKLSGLPTGPIFTDPTGYTFKTDDRNVWYRFDMNEVLAGEPEDVDGVEYHLLSGMDSMGAFSFADAEEYRLTGLVMAGDFRIIGAKVELVHVDADGYERLVGEGYTNKAGRYTIYFKPGEYLLRVSADGYKRVEVDADLTHDRNASMNVLDMEADKGTDIPRTLMYVAAITGLLLIVASVAYRIYLKKNPVKSVVYDDLD